MVDHISRRQIAMEDEEEDEPLVCLDDHDEDGRHCSGPVEYRMALSGTGRSFPRCEKHWGLRLEEQDRINERYPDSPLPPSDFDPTYAGERWDEDDW